MSPKFFLHQSSLCKRTAAVLFFLIFSFLAGNWLGYLSFRHASAPTSAGASAENWGLSFQQEGKPPVANATSDYLKQFQAHYAADTTEKIIYLTFDAGYENGNTAAILDALKKHHAPAAFFLAGRLRKLSYFIERIYDILKKAVSG